MKTITRYEIREYKTDTSYSVSLSSKLKTRQQAIRIISRLGWKGKGRNVVMVPLEIKI
jgi:hypothetical protein